MQMQMRYLYGKKCFGVEKLVYRMKIIDQKEDSLTDFFYGKG